ncbi:MAG: NAD(P)H-hydrate epimerase [Candidatus Abyssobacteria bacterium SURF_5]|uniref:NAD(P)H-hydrate epimerase n=1 Tax=Abyssobacteria bacterium (strain SURF_5) TaxID=2093360 RepID=A0A3A4N891_ABYX5|nr:MAG: NAD(P)H-hydrate epimerase [Candidatus Abyssubacteria bacterium SURF_5]
MERSELKYVTPELMRRLDRFAIDTIGIPGVVLMENAGRSVFESAYAALGNNGQPAVVFCGRGNNGGDGFVAARHLINNGIETSIFVVGALSKIRGDAAINLRILRKMGAQVQKVSAGLLPELRVRMKRCGIIIDALLGTGLSGEVTGLYRDVIGLINEAGCPVLSVDIPSGLDGLTGNPLGISVIANTTVTFQFPKKAFENPKARNYTGQLRVIDIGIPVHLYPEPL